MYRVLLGKLCTGRLLLEYIPKKYLHTINANFCPYYTTNIMPPKRKAATTRSEPADLTAGGDQGEPVLAKVRRGRSKKEPEVENTLAEEKDKKGKPKKTQKEEESESNQEEKKKSTKKLVPAKGNSKEKEKDNPENKKTNRAKKIIKTDEQPEEDQEEKVLKKKGKKEEETNGVTKEKGSRKKKADVLAEEAETKSRKKSEKPGPSNSTITQWDKINFVCTKKNGENQKANLKISCWNIGGLKSWVKKECLQYLEYEDPDIFCVQETKCNEDKLPDEIKELKGYKQYWCASNKEGYAGVGLFTKKEPRKITYGINVPDQDEDGRCITAEFDDYYIVCVYVPNAGRKLVTLPKRLEWNTAFKDYIKSLDDKKPVIICGDMNVAHTEIDLARPTNNTRNAGFTKEEREGMTDFLQNGYIDAFRKLYPDNTDVYTFWTYMANARSKNIGWRLDYFIVSERIMDKVCDTVVRSEVLGSDHCPITLFINM